MEGGDSWLVAKRQAARLEREAAREGRPRIAPRSQPNAVVGDEDEYVESELQEDGAGERQRLYVTGEDAVEEEDGPDEAGQSLLEAAREGDSPLFFALLAAGAPVDACDPRDGSSALHHVAVRGLLQETKALIAAGACVDAGAERHPTPLYLAASAGFTHVVHLLLLSKANAALADATGRTALHVAAQRGWENCVSVLLASRAPLGALSDAGFTPAHEAAAAGKPACLRLLLAAGASADTGAALAAAVPEGRSTLIEGLFSCSVPFGCETETSRESAAAPPLLHTVVEHADTQGDAAAECLTVLLVAGASADRLHGGATALHLAARRGAAVLCERLLEGGAQACEPLDAEGRSALDLAASHGQFGACAVLMDAGAGAQRAITAASSAVAPLLAACALELPAAAVRRFLLERAHPSGLHPRLAPAVAVASQIRELSSQRASIPPARLHLEAENLVATLEPPEVVAARAAFPHAFSPCDAPSWASVDQLLAAASADDAERVSEIISRGVDVNARRALDGATALHCAAGVGAEGAVRRLLAAGADWTLRWEPAIAGIDGPLGWCFGRITTLLGEECTPGPTAAERALGLARAPLAELADAEATRRARLAAADQAAATALAERNERRGMLVAGGIQIRRTF